MGKVSGVPKLPRYSPLCDVDPAVAIAWYRAYGDYARASVLAGGGYSGDSLRGLFSSVGPVYFAGHGGTRGISGGGDVAGGAFRVLAGSGSGGDDVVGRVASLDGQFAPVDAVDVGGESGGCPAVDVVGESNEVGRDNSGDVEDVPNEDGAVASGGSVGGAAGSNGVSPSGVRPFVPGRLKRGPNYARNQANRERKKQAKASRRGDFVERKGFFSGCDEVLQQELRESRARMLILENQRKAAQYARDVARMQSPVQLALDAVDLVRKTYADSKCADPRVMGWAKTVVSAEVESLAKSAPTSVPSLESISLSEPGDGRATEYKRRYEELTLLYDNADYYNPEDRADEFKMLQAEFADVVKGDVEAANRYKFARELRVAIAEAAVNGEYACSRAVEAYLDAAENIADD